MAGNTFGTLFRITTAGESHGKGNIVIIDGHPAGIIFSEEDMSLDLARRRPGQSGLTTPRKEQDVPQILSGVFEGKTTGASLAIFVPNENVRSKDYSNIEETYRPGHADFTYDAKYGHRDYRGGGRSSARETVVRVCAGSLAKKILEKLGIITVGYVVQVGNIVAKNIQKETVVNSDVEKNDIRCPDPIAAKEMIDLIEKVKKEGDSIGGVCEIIVRGTPAGLGEPVFDKIKADFAKALLSIPAVNGFEYGGGFASACLKGSEFNDEFINEDGKIKISKNQQGGMLGGITSGANIIMRASLRPTSSIAKSQKTVDKSGNETMLEVKGRHDPCLLPRFVPIGEAMINIVLLDHLLRHRAIKEILEV
ncbi:chorismate synthase [Bacteriovoracaceae bacterium]|nr:chorismate synthase [Bacteriovoracaceae bacterium]